MSLVDYFEGNRFWGMNRKSRICEKLRAYAAWNFCLDAIANMIVPAWLSMTKRNPKLKLQPEKVFGQKVIVTLTSFPARLSYVWLVVECLLRQTIKPDVIALYLSREQVPDMTKVPKRLIEQQRRGLQIRLCDGDLRSHKKYYYAFQEYPNDIVITVDDDLFYPSLLITKAEGITDVFCNRQLFNGPIWFLCCLFWNHVIFYLICRSSNHCIIRSIASVVIGCAGYLMGQAHVFLPAFLDVAMSTMPYFAFGYYLKVSNILNMKVSNSYCVIIFLALYSLSSYLISIIPYRIGFSNNLLNGGVAMYVVTMMGSVSMIFFCKSFVHLPILSWIGKYSLLLMCLHHMIYRPVMVLFPCCSIIVAGVTVAICCLLIPPMVRFLPWFTGHANLIKER